MKGLRTIVVNDKTYGWCVGRSSVLIRCPDGSNFPVDFSVLTGMNWPDIERGQWKKYFSITPRHVAEFIKKEIDV